MSQEKLSLGYIKTDKTEKKEGKMKKIVKGYQSTELYVVMALIAKTMGLEAWITPETIQATHTQVSAIAAGIQGVAATDNSVFVYVLAIIYVAGRTWLKHKELNLQPDPQKA